MLLFGKGMNPPIHRILDLIAKVEGLSERKGSGENSQGWSEYLGDGSDGTDYGVPSGGSGGGRGQWIMGSGARRYIGEGKGTVGT